VAHSVTRYYPTPLEVMQNPWMQWVIVSPREIDAPEYDDIRAAQKTSEENRKVIEEAKQAVIKLKIEVDGRAQDAKTAVESLNQKNVEAQGIVASIRISSTVATFSDDHINQLLQDLLPTYLDKVLTAEQIATLHTNFHNFQSTSPKPHEYSESEVLQLIRQDTLRAFDYFHKHGITIPTPHAELYPRDPNFMNSFWDGSKLIYGMGMVNSPEFGPYEPSIVYHEVTHALFDLSFQGESGAVSESICDVIAVVVRGSGWTIGAVRTTSGAPQFLRSLEAPGTAYDNPRLGKDPQPDNMSRYVKTDDDNGGVHINVGILNKAAYLISEGGSQGTINIPRGIGRVALGNLARALGGTEEGERRRIARASFAHLGMICVDAAYFGRLLRWPSERLAVYEGEEHLQINLHSNSSEHPSEIESNFLIVVRPLK